MNLYKDGLTVGKLVEILKKCPQDIPLIVSSDEEGNTLYKGFYLDLYADALIIAGLSGCEYDE